MPTIETQPTVTIPLYVHNEDVIYVGNTRVTFDTVVHAFLHGATPEEICYQYPTLELADIYAVIGYYLHNQAEVDSYLEQRKAAAHDARQQNEESFPAHGIRSRLLMRRQAQQP